MSNRSILATRSVGKVRLDIVANPITTAAWVVLSAAWPAPCSAVTISYSGDAILLIAKGAVASEVELPLYIVPGENMEEMIPLEIAKNLNISVKALDQNIAAGELIINLFG